MLQSVDARNKSGHDEMGEWPGLGSGLHATTGRQFVIVTCGLGGRLGPPFYLALRVGELLDSKRLTVPAF